MAQSSFPKSKCFSFGSRPTDIHEKSLKWKPVTVILLCSSVALIGFELDIMWDFKVLLIL